jgi:riboflavin kinase
MTELKIQHILTLTYLLSKGAKHNFVTTTTSNFIERIISGRKISVKITPKGYSEMVKLSQALQKSLTSSSSNVLLKGTLVSGMGEGAYYMSLKGYTKQFKSKIGYVPFPGTFNVKLGKKEYTEAIRQFEGMEGMHIDGYSDGKRTYGWVKCFKAKLNSSFDCELIRLERTHHDTSTIELIAKNNLRKTAKLSDGSKITITIPINGK